MYRKRASIVTCLDSVIEDKKESKMKEKKKYAKRSGQLRMFKSVLIFYFVSQRDGELKEAMYWITR